MADGTLSPTDGNVKRCPRCGETKALSAFYVSPKGRRESWCRECQAVYRADYYEQHRDAIRERKGPYNREYSRRRKQTDPEFRRKSIETVRKWWSGLTEEEKYRLNQRKKLVKRYGLTLEDWDRLYAAHGGKCAICREPPSKSRDLHVDHDHATGRVRGLLCVRCNTALAWFERLAGSMDVVLAYLRGANV